MYDCLVPKKLSLQNVALISRLKEKARAKENFVVPEFFDDIWYRQIYAINFKDRAEAWKHYIEFGAQQGYDPNWIFDTDWYTSTYPEISALQENPYSHYLSTGWRIGMDPSPWFNSSEYLDMYPDVRASGLNPLTHYLRHGLNEGRYPMLHSWPKSLVPWRNLNSTSQRRIDHNLVQPTLAILIPVFNNWFATERCLRSILQTADCLSIDIYIVNDSSTDETVSELSRYPFVKVIHTPQNLGFTKACNHAFKLLDGYEYIYLLNNDTEVLEGFLTQSLHLMDTNPEIGLVGSTFFFPNGKIQECGGVVWSDGTGHNFGRGDTFGSLEYEFSRQVDYCSGAGLLIKNKALKAVDFFDDRYAPAYYEDTDLAFKFREAGYQVWVSSRSRVIHYEGVSHGTDESSGIKSFQKINQQKFKEKWHSELTDYHDSSADEQKILKAAMRLSHFGESAVLWIDDLVPDPKRDSGSVRAQHLLNLSVTLKPFIVFVPMFQDHDLLLDPSIVEHKYIVAKDIETSILFLRSISVEISHVWVSRVTSGIKAISKILELCPEAKIIYDTVDLHHVRLAREAALEDSTSKQIEAQTYECQELRLIKISDTTILLSEYEKKLIDNLEIPGRTELLSNVHVSSTKSVRFNETKGLFFIGGFRHSPNISGILWFVKQVWPLVPETIRISGLTIAGSHMPEEILNLKDQNISTVGWVEDSGNELRKHRISIAPLLVGAGVKGKIGEAMAEGIPVVATNIAMEGMGAEPGRHAIVADTPEDFASAIVHLYQDESKWNEIQTSARALIEDKYSDTVALEKLRQIFLD